MSQNFTGFNNKLTTNLLGLWSHIGVCRRYQFVLLLVLMIVTSIAEVLSISVVMPFLSVLTSPEQAFNYLVIKQVPIDEFGIQTPNQLLLPLTIGFISASLLAGLMRMLLLWTSTKLSFAIGADISGEIYERTLYQPYAVHANRNTSEIINAVANKTNDVSYILLMLLTIISSSIMLVIILLMLIYVDAGVTFFALGGLSFIYIAVIFLTRKTQISNSQTIAEKSTLVIKVVQEGLGGIRDVLIDGSQALYCQAYRKADLLLRSALSSRAFIGGSPRYLMEALGMALIAAVSYFLLAEEDRINDAIPVLGALALGAQRLLPVMQQAYSSWSGIIGNQASLRDVALMLEQPMPNRDDELRDSVAFEKQLVLENVSYRYSNEHQEVLSNVTLTIFKGTRVGIIGETGSGKSTLLDILMGLLSPSSGKLIVDGSEITSSNQREWQRHIAHVPQTIYLADSTIEENIAFGVLKNQINIVRVKKSANQAQIAETIESLPAKYQSFVGERGVRLSGGQRQRIGIARALYKKSDVIIFDEATSALDSDTEDELMKAINNLDNKKTVIMVAHRISSLKGCSQIFELRDGKVKNIGSYDQMILNSKS
jgi:ABC-type multidrug transport system fused ATPase/permease subunit